MRILLIVCCLSVTLFSCKKEKQDVVNLNELQGEWTVAPTKGVMEDSQISYTFQEDSLCVIDVYHALSKDTSYQRTYTVSQINNIITLYNENNVYTEQYRIKRLSNNRMHWENASSGDGNTDKVLFKAQYYQGN
jgi:hypothetical protein